MIVSADNFFMKTDETGKKVYVFDKTQIGAAHAQCMIKFVRALDLLDESGCGGLKFRRVIIMRGIPGSGKSTLASQLDSPDTLIVDNTNTRAVEIAPYWQLASAWGIPVEIKLVLCEPSWAYRRGTHGVPFETVYEQSRTILTEQLPSWWKQNVINGPGDR